MGRAAPYYHHAIALIWELVSVYDGERTFEKQFARVTEAQGLLWAAHFCQSEVCNGGFHQFFYNDTGLLAPEAVRGFELIEVPQAADVITRAMATFGHHYPRDRAKRLKALGTPESLHPIDEAFYAATGTRAFAEQADRFVRAHMDLFFRS